MLHYSYIQDDFQKIKIIKQRWTQKQTLNQTLFYNLNLAPLPNQQTFQFPDVFVSSYRLQNKNKKDPHENRNLNQSSIQPLKLKQLTKHDLQQLQIQYARYKQAFSKPKYQSPKHKHSNQNQSQLNEKSNNYPLTLNEMNKKRKQKVQNLILYGDIHKINSSKIKI